MGYSFGGVNTDNIDMGTSVPHDAQLFTVWVRFKLNSGGAGARQICSYRDNGNIQFQIYYDTTAGFVVCHIMQSGVPVGVAFAISENVEYTLGLVFVNAANLLLLYMDADASPKSSAAPPFGGVDIPSTEHFLVGNYYSNLDASLDGIVYEVGWWPGVQLSGAELAAMKAGTPPGTDPSNYWGLISNPNASFGGINGVVTGASVVAHTGTNLYVGGGGGGGAEKAMVHHLQQLGAY